MGSLMTFNVKTDGQDINNLAPYYLVNESFLFYFYKW